MRRLKWDGLFVPAACVMALLCARGSAQERTPDIQPGRKQLSLSYILLVDNSASLRSQLPRVVEAATSIVNKSMATDEVSVIRFAGHDRIETAWDFTGNSFSLHDALDGMHVEMGGTAVFDALSFAARRLEQHRHSQGAEARHAVILITDGDDTDSRRHTLSSVLKQIESARVQVYVIGFTRQLESQGKNTRGRAESGLDTLARETGGRVYYPETPADIERTASTISRELHGH